MSNKKSHTVYTSTTVCNDRGIFKITAIGNYRRLGDQRPCALEDNNLLLDSRNSTINVLLPKLYFRT